MNCPKCGRPQEISDGLRVCANGHGYRLEGRSLQAVENTAASGSPKLIRQKTKDTRNKAEKSFESEVLFWRQKQGEIERYAFEAVTLRLANGTRLTPDYYCVMADGSGMFADVKGEKRQKSGQKTVIREDAIVKLKVAKAIYPEYKFLVVWKDDGQWREQEILG